jgi:hypothetical protein
MVLVEAKSWTSWRIVEIPRSSDAFISSVIFCMHYVTGQDQTMIQVAHETWHQAGIPSFQEKLVPRVEGLQQISIAERFHTCKPGPYI